VSPPLHIEVERQLRFTFQRPTWDAVKWDEDPAYVRGLRRHDGKAVDIVATAGRRSLHLFEVKDPRGHWPEYRDRNSVEELAQIVADKVRDTLAGLLFCRDRHPCDHLLVHLKTLFDRDEKVSVIFWLESFQLDRPLATTLKGRIEHKLQWLKPNVVVTSRALWPGMPGLTVESMRGAPWRG
jgi:ATP-dependent helicase YprA (DUF1998 family)